MPSQIAIVGAGLVGRILALECRLAGMSVTLFDRDSLDGQQSCAYTGAGMLAPYTELEQTEPIVAALGVESLLLYPQLLKKLAKPVFFQKNGTLVLAHRQDCDELSRFERSLKFKLDNSEWKRFDQELHNSQIDPLSAYPPAYLHCDRRRLLDLEADLPTSFTEGIYLSEEGQVDNRQLLEALKITLQDANVDWQAGKEVALSDIYACPQYDFIFDCRGLGSQPDLNQLRGVRGELIVVETKGVRLNRPIRMMHPRHPIYIVPRESNRFIIGATSIESDDRRAITVQSALELLSAACTIHPAFADATIIESRVNCRPALPNNLPSIIVSAKNGKSPLIHINGLYRHGFLLSPKLVQLALDYIVNGTMDASYRQLFIEDKCETEYRLPNGETALAISN